MVRNSNLMQAQLSSSPLCVPFMLRLQARQNNKTFKSSKMTLGLENLPNGCQVLSATKERDGLTCVPLLRRSEQADGSDSLV